MKKTIRGIRYDTDAAELVVDACANKGRPDAWQAGLYLTPRAGRFFLAGTGGPLTIFASTGAGSRIIPLTDDEAADFIGFFFLMESVTMAKIIKKRQGHDPAILKCDCGEKVLLTDGLDNLCDVCGACYNLSGQRVKPSWDEGVEEPYWDDY